jgi:CHAT domain-containing protein
MSASTRARAASPFEAIIEELAQARDDSSRSSIIDAHAEALVPAFIEQLTDEVASRTRTDGRAAVSLSRGSQLVAEAMGDDRAKGLAERAVGNTLNVITEDYPRALEHYRTAREHFERCGDLVEAGRTMSSSVQALILLGRYTEAEEIAEQARVIFKGHGETKRLARLKIPLGNIYHRQDRFREALALYEEAYEALREYDDPAGIEGVAASLSNIAGCCIMLNDYPRALRFYREARSFCASHGLTSLVAQADYNVSYLYYLRGDYSRSIEMLNAARQLFKRTRDLYHCALCDMDQAEIYLDLNLFAEAHRLARRARRQFKKLGTGYEVAKSLAMEAIATSNLGRAFRALSVFEKARETFVTEGNEVWPWVIDLYRASVLLEEGRLFEAHRLASKVLPVFEDQRLGVKANVCRLLLARLSMRMGDLFAARSHCERALDGAIEADSPLALYQAQFLAGQIAEAGGLRETALASYESAAATLETLRSSLQREEMKISFGKNRMGVYESLVDLQLSDGDDPDAEARAFEHIERAKARGLIDLILGAIRGGPSVRGGESELARKVQFLREELNWYYRRIEHEQLGREGFNAERVGDLAKSARARETELLDALREVPSDAGPLSALKSHTPVSLGRIQASLGVERALVEYFVARGTIYCSVITDSGLEIHPLAVEDRVRSIVQRLQFQLSKFQLPPDYLNTFDRAIHEATLVHLNELYESLVAPLRHRLVGRDLVVVPHGVTHYLPFHALHDGSRYLVEDFTISYAPSASVFAHCNERSPAEGTRTLVLGVPDKSTPHILEEVHAVASSVNDPELYLDSEATAEILREKALSSRIVHIATHGYYRQDNPMFSAIRLSDSYLSLHDLYELPLPVELVTVSACATGLSVVVDGDELVGLVRGLLYAGARSTIVTLWNIQDRATASLMQAFYSHLGTGMDRAAALRCAMLEQLTKTPQPYYWAPYILVGRVGPLAGR